MNAASFYASRARRWLDAREAERRLLRRCPGLSLGPGVQIVSPDRLEVGPGSSFQHGVHVHCGGLEWSSGEGFVRIGAGAVLSPHCVVYGAGGVTIGERFDCGPGAMVFSSRSEYGGGAARHRFAPVTIGDDVTLYAGSIVGPGVTIGDGAAVAAGSVVLADVPPRTLVAGTPARPVRDIG